MNFRADRQMSVTSEGEGAVSGPSYRPARGRSIDPEGGGSGLWFPRALQSLRRVIGRRTFVCLLGLLLIDLVIMFAYFGPFVPGKGPLVYGDLPAVYTYAGVQAKWILSGAIYIVIEESASMIWSWTIVQNALYATTFVAPSVGLYFFVLPFVRFKPSAVAVAAVLGTMLNPLFLSDFIMGGEEYGLWLMFSFLGFGLLCSFLFFQNSKWWQPVAAGICFGLGSSQTFGMTGMDVGAVFLTALPLMGIVLYGVVRSWKLATRDSVLAGIGSFFVTYAAVLVPILGAVLGQANTVLGSTAHTEEITGRAISSLQYTFRPYGFASALFAVPPTPTFTGFTTVPTVGWITIVVLSLSAAGISLSQRRGPVSWLNGIFLSTYLFYVVVIVGIHSGVLLPVFSAIPQLDLLDGVDLYVYAEFICLPFMFVTFFRLVEDAWQHVRAWSSPAQYESSSLGFVMPRVRRAWIHRLALKQGSEGLASGIAITFVVSLVLVSAVPSAASLESSVYQNPGVYPRSPFATPALSPIRDWYDTNGSNATGYFLPLPDNLLSANAISGVIPYSRLWTIPILSADLVPGFNPGEYVQVMKSLSNGSINTWSSQLGVAGVQYIILVAGDPLVTIVPGYVAGAPTPVGYSWISGELTNSSDLKLVFHTADAAIFENLLYVPPMKVHPGLLTFAPSSQPKSLTFGDVLPASGFSGWSVYPTGGFVAEANGSALIPVNGSGSPSFVVLWCPLSGVATAPMLSNTTQAGAPYPLRYSLLSIDFQDRLVIPQGTFLQTYIAWYNTTTPTGLSSWFAETDIGYFYAGVSLAAKVMSVPQGTMFARVIYTAFANSSLIAGDVYAAPPVADRVLQPVNLTSDASAQLEVANALEEWSAVPANSIVLETPFVGGLAPAAIGGAYIASLLPEVAVNPNSSASFTFNLTGATFPVIRQVLAPTTVRLLLSGGFVTQSANVSLTIMGQSWTAALSSANTSAEFSLPVQSIGQAASVDVMGGGLFSLISLSLEAPETSSNRTQLFTIPLPIGLLTGSIEGGSAMVVDRTAPSLGSSAALSFADVVPIFGVIAVTVGSYAVNRRRRLSNRQGNRADRL